MKECELLEKIEEIIEPLYDEAGTKELMYAFDKLINTINIFKKEQANKIRNIDEIREEDILYDNEAGAMIVKKNPQEEEFILTAIFYYIDSGEIYHLTDLSDMECNAIAEYMQQTQQANKTVVESVKNERPFYEAVKKYLENTKKYILDTSVSLADAKISALLFVREIDCLIQEYEKKEEK